MGPNTYDISRERINRLSTTRATPDIRMHEKHVRDYIAGPGPGKYNTTDAYEHTTPQLPRYTMKFRSDVFMNFAQPRKGKSPGPADYDVSHGAHLVSRSLGPSGPRE